MTSQHPPRLVATDLDGTLLRSDESLSPRTRSALTFAASLGVQHIIATGRSVRSAGPIFDALGYKGLAVCGQGAQIYDAGAHRIVVDHELDPDVVRPVLEQLAAQVGPVYVAVTRSGLDGGFYGYRSVPWPWTRVPLIPVLDDDELWAAPALKAYVAHESLTVDELAAAARAFCDGQLEAFNAGGNLVEIVPAGVNKGTGLAEVAARLDIAAADTVSFGDMPSDVPMLEWSGYAVAMKNGHEAAIGVADEVAPPNDDDGVAVVLERIYGP